MSAEVATTISGLRPKPSTRSSIRHSLNFSSMGKALADVMHKEGKDSGDKEKGSKKPKDAASRRSSLVPAPSRSSTEKQLGGKKGKDTSPESKTITRHTRRTSALPKTGTTSSEEQSSSPSTFSPKTTVTRSSTLRPRSSLNTSALPKYRPRSLLVDSAVTKKPSSPTRAGTRRRLSSSDDEKEDDHKGKVALRLDPPSSSEKSGRPISPLPHRGALKVNLTAAINVQPATPERKAKRTTPTPQSTPPQRRTSPSKSSKISTKSSVVSSTTRSVIARPPSSTSSSSSAHTPRTPKTPTSVSDIFGASTGGSGRMKGSAGLSPLRSAIPAPPESPLGRLSAKRKAEKSSPGPSNSRSVSTTPTPTIFTEGDSMDSMEANDVEFMLSSAVSPTAPTPALPRYLRANHNQDNDGDDPHTPSRPSGFLPTRANLSYLSPVPPSSDISPFVRPRPRQPGNDRGSILSWEQLALHNRSLGAEEVGHMLSEIPAPFRSGAVSPAPSSLPDIPESPSFSALPSPTGYGSISQVLLPDVTPSPAVHNTTQRFEVMGPEIPQVDAAIVTLLRLQLASAENMAKERLVQMQSLEAQLHNAKEARLRDAEELARQISVLEEQVHGNLKTDDQKSEYTASLEEQLAMARVASERAVSSAVSKAHEDAAASRAAVLATQQKRWELASAACETGAAWNSVRDTAEGELELIRANREMLSVLLAGLDRHMFYQSA